ncbi:hypothetical protein [Pseudonocardia nigra]|uniref:hypothetical protein n=1 Tax=Pseudonocardia nigra TaxID=1921578 RepID=UPI001C5D24F1|nr:hypothetical protein [Pseudonocardia nigra]
MVRGELSKAQQQKIVGEGLAVGVLALGVEALTSNKASVEFAFRRAWRDWSGRAQFPQVRAEASRCDIVGILHRSANRRGPVIAHWTSDGPEYVPALCFDWPVEEAGDAVTEELGVSYAQWVHLAEAFVAGLGDDEVRRSG